MDGNRSVCLTDTLLAAMNSCLYDTQFYYHDISAKKTKHVFYSQIKALIPFGVEVGADGFGLLLGLIFGVWDELEFNIWIRQSIGVHGDQVSALAD